MSSAAGGGGGGGGGVDAEAMCPLCQHEHAVGTVCTVCGHSRTPTQPVFRNESELPRQPNVFAVHTYTLGEAQLRQDALPPNEAERNTCGSWAMEKILRGRLREELSRAPDAQTPAPTPAVLTTLSAPMDGDPTHEADVHDPMCRHVLGKIGDACVSTVRWRLVQSESSVPGEGAVNLALLDRLFVLPYYRRRRVARTTVLNCLVDIFQLQSAQGLTIHRVSVVIPNEARLANTHALFTGMGFSLAGSSAVDLTGMWAAAAAGSGAAGGAARQFIELALPFASVLPLLTAAQAAAEGVRPPPARA